VAVIIDHFGTAMSSLSYLRHLPVDGVKIDKSFIRTMHQNKSDMVIVRSVIDLALSLGLSATAEGVENKETWDDLRAFGCIAAQGYWCARPTPADLVPWLAGLVEVGENIGH
nr:EAL domain-containing protein [Actinomycetota bacterium]